MPPNRKAGRRWLGGGGAWKVAYADFVTAMMAFFLVMWIVSQDKPVKEAIAQYFNNPYGSGMVAGAKSGSLLPNKDGGALPSPKGPSRAPTGHVSETTVRMSEDPDERGRGKSSLQMMHDKNQSAVGTIVPFDSDSAELDARGKQVLDELAPDLLGKLTKIEIRGHAAGRPLPPDSPYAGHLAALLRPQPGHDETFVGQGNRTGADSAEPKRQLRAPARHARRKPAEVSNRASKSSCSTN